VAASKERFGEIVPHPRERPNELKASGHHGSLQLHPAASSASETLAHTGANGSFRDNAATAQESLY
jgi:hypothetical protein